MLKKPIRSPHLPPAVGGYVHGLDVTAPNRFFFISGQTPERPDGSVPEGFEAQCRQVWANIGAVLAGVGFSYDSLVKVTTYLTDRSQAEANSRIRQEILGKTRVALTVVVAQTLDEAWLLEIEAVAADLRRFDRR